MPIDWRPLLDSIRVSWKDRGNNCSRGYVNINCPFCGDDPSFHLGISEETGRYTCWRNDSHWGYDPARLLQTLVKSRVKALALIDSYQTTYSPISFDAPPKPSNDKWDKFLLATESPRCVEYLRDDRGFPNAEEVILSAGLRWTPIGADAHRILFPLYNYRMELCSWTGRAATDSTGLRYRVNPHPDIESLVYTDAGHWGLSTSTGQQMLVLVEGPMDALKINAYKNMRNVLAVALTGLAFTTGRLNLLKKWQPIHTFLCVDEGVPIATTEKIRDSLGAGMSVTSIRVEGYKDAAEIPHNEINPWLQGVIREASIINPRLARAM